jgi:hypothetical protein
MAIAIATNVGTISMAIVDLLASTAIAMAITDLTSGIPDADGQQSACRDGHHQARSATGHELAVGPRGSSSIRT